MRKGTIYSFHFTRARYVAGHFFFFLILLIFSPQNDTSLPVFIASICVIVIKTIFSVFFFTRCVLIFSQQYAATTDRIISKGFRSNYIFHIRETIRAIIYRSRGKKERNFQRQRRQIKRRNFSRRCMKFLFKKKNKQKMRSNG